MAARLKLAKLHVRKPQALIYHNVRGKLLICPPQVRTQHDTRIYETYALAYFDLTTL